MILDQIVAAKRAFHAWRTPADLDALAARAAALPAARGFAAALRAPGPLKVIAEFKRRSPSAGVIRAGADPIEIALQYGAAGAAALSVLTDHEFFDGGWDDLARARGAVALPVLRKDFLLDERDVIETRLGGADAVLLIVRLLEEPQLGVLLRLAAAVGLDALVEVHDEREAETARAAGATLIGVNHRDLDTLAIDLGVSLRVARALGPGPTLVGESGLGTRADLERMRDYGMQAVLIGETLMRAAVPGLALAELLAS